jgi:hypothetical protein
MVTAAYADKNSSDTAVETQNNTASRRATDPATPWTIALIVHLRHTD